MKIIKIMLYPLQKVMMYWDFLNVFASISLYTLIALQVFRIDWENKMTLPTYGCLLLCYVIKEAHERMVNYLVPLNVTKKHTLFFKKFSSCEDLYVNLAPALKVQFQHITLLNAATLSILLCVQFYLLTAISHFLIDVNAGNLLITLTCVRYLVYIFIGNRVLSFLNLLSTHAHIQCMDDYDFEELKTIFDNEADIEDIFQVCVVSAIDYMVTQQDQFDRLHIKS
ncbi:MAG: hypothetical protein ACRCST_13200 [Turicibacter sp.]